MVEVMTQLEKMPSNSVVGTTGKPEVLPEMPVDHPVDHGEPSRPGLPEPSNGDRKPEERPGVGPETPAEGESPGPDVPGDLPAQGEDKRKNRNEDEGGPPAGVP